MPIFEYQCSDCKNIFEEIVLANEKVACPKCKSDHTQKFISKPCKCKSADNNFADYNNASSQAPAMASSGGCSGCAGGSCASCH